jgi:hypothetical protein
MDYRGADTYVHVYNIRGPDVSGAMTVDLSVLPGPLVELSDLTMEELEGNGDGLIEAAAALRLARACESLLSPFPLGARAFRQSASIAQRRPSDVLSRLGLRGAPSEEAAAAPATASVPK